MGFMLWRLGWLGGMGRAGGVLAAAVFGLTIFHSLLLLSLYVCHGWAGLLECNGEVDVLYTELLAYPS